MKKSLVVLLSLALGLTACTPAASQPISEAPAATAETAPAEETAESPAAIGTLRNIDDANNTGKALYLEAVQSNGGNYLDKSTILEIDYATAQQRFFSAIQEPSYQLEKCFVQGDTLYYTTKDNNDAMALHRYSLADGTQTATPLDQYFFTLYLDENSLYLFAMGYNEYAGMQRLNLQTGATEAFTLPGQTIEVCDGADGRFLIRRLLSEVPLSSLQGEEQRDAALQNATSEYDWWNPLDGSLEPFLQEPYYGEQAETGSLQYRWYLGRTKDKLYFYLADQKGSSYVHCRVERCGLDGSNPETIMTLADGQGQPGVYKKGGEIYWLIQDTGSGVKVYQTGDGTTRQVENPERTPWIWPRALTDDGRVLLGKPDADGQKALQYCLVTEENYLAGHFTGTDVVPAEP